MDRGAIRCSHAANRVGSESSSNELVPAGSLWNERGFFESYVGLVEGWPNAPESARMMAICGTVAAVTYQGTFSSRFALPNAAPDTVPDGGARRRATVAFGNGSARVEAESFQGSVILARPGDAVVRQR